MLLKEVRQAKGWSQQTLADKMEINRVSVTQIETGVRQPWPAFRAKAAEILETSEDVLFGE